MNRKEMYELIDKYKLREDIKNVEGKSYTNLPNSTLEYYIRDYENNTQFMNKVESETRFNKLIEVLEKKHILLKSEIDYINK